MKYELFHAAFEEAPILVTTLETDLPVDRALDELWTATQNVDESWVKARGQFGLKVEPSASAIAAGGARSTSIGDFTAIHFEHGVTMYRCMRMGWEPDPALSVAATDSPAP